MHFDQLCTLAMKGKFVAGNFDECECCRYFGAIRYGIDAELGEKQISDDTNMCKGS